MSGVTDITAEDLKLLKCPKHHVTHSFLACDVRSDCLAESHQSCTYDGKVPMMPCDDGVEQVPMTLVCDHREDCTDGSDELDCVYPRCLPGYFTCDNSQCVPASSTCDAFADCKDQSDEKACGPPEIRLGTVQDISPSGVVELGGRGGFYVVKGYSLYYFFII